MSTTNYIEQHQEGGEGESKWRIAPGRCDAVLRKLTVHVIFARIVAIRRLRLISFNEKDQICDTLND